MNTPTQHLSPGQEVVYVDHDKKTHKAKITTVYNDSSAHVEFKDGAAVAEFSPDSVQPNTFHFEPASPKAEPKKEATNK